MLAKSVTRGVGSRGSGREVPERGDICLPQLIHVVGQQKPTQYCKAITLQFKHLYIF